ncbi:LysR family transcriptional regulator [Cupriavidus sp. CV2]|uniref:LysR family transcriptional regulator n=1 Tax=Cupriavidus ulmosensis TaxID=3065913 RepID=UPI00296B1485|nr:LysR family transcriptional regulator [Cupriavidus sp. CV2]MDW3684456.1 LysR family transcriptional regulator [Cupriavidus sp. CV2]
MDRLRALHYFIAAAKANSFSGAARSMGVSVAAVSKLVTALERNLGARLFERYAHGLVLTASGASYLAACQPALAQLADADEQVSAASTRPRGTVVVGVQHVIAQQALAPALPRFNALYPDIQIDARDFRRITDEEIGGVDVLLVLGWPRVGELVQRSIGAAGFVVCAAPAYWAEHGMPQHPNDLSGHNCLTLRGNTGTLMDLWQFRRGDEEVSVPVRGWLVADNVHRDIVVSLALAGAGVVRILDWANREDLASGTLVPALTDWEPTEVPPVNLLYRPSVRRIPRVRLFIEFVTQLFREIELERERRISATETPDWLKAKRPYSRASASVARRR